MPPRPLRARVAVLGVGLIVAVTGCSSDGSGKAPKAAEPTPIAQLQSASMRVPLRPFCEQVPAAAVRDAVGKPSKATAWGNGDKATIETDLTDVVHEFGCSWTSGTGGTASAWLFATPVDPTQAAKLVKKGAARAGCKARSGLTFGNPSQQQVCAQTDGGTRVRISGLFESAWLSCEVTGTDSRKQLRQRADAWCVQVANAAAR